MLGAGREGLICLPGTHSKWVEVRVASALDPLAGTRALFKLGAMLAAKEAS